MKLFGQSTDNPGRVLQNEIAAATARIWRRVGGLAREIGLSKVQGHCNNDDPAAAKIRAEIYYPIIDRAIKQLPNNECEARRTLYDRARVMLTNKLHAQNPSQIRRERRALELAIRRVEVLAAAREIINQKLDDLLE
jgi:hypothetical protein